MIRCEFNARAGGRARRADEVRLSPTRPSAKTPEPPVNFISASPLIANRIFYRQVHILPLKLIIVDTSSLIFGEGLPYARHGGGPPGGSHDTACIKRFGGQQDCHEANGGSKDAIHYCLLVCCSALR